MASSPGAARACDSSRFLSSRYDCAIELRWLPLHSLPRQCPFPMTVRLHHQTAVAQRTLVPRAARAGTSLMKAGTRQLSPYSCSARARECSTDALQSESKAGASRRAAAGPSRATAFVRWASGNSRSSRRRGARRVPVPVPVRSPQVQAQVAAAAAAGAPKVYLYPYLCWCTRRARRW
jgi:hypothetical protein